MCKVIIPIFRRQWWNLWDATHRHRQCQFRIFLSASRAHLCRFNEMASIKDSTNCDELFQGTKDRYNGVIVNSSKETCSFECFTTTLEKSLKSWSKNNVRTVWFSVALEQADWIPILVKNGFKFHHTVGDDVVMYKWLPKSEECNIPPYAHTMVGVGSVIINSSGNILVVQERFSGIAQWKLPGGYLDPGENIADAAIREVFEETGIRTEFQYLTCFRHMHNANFGCSDFYFIACLKPMSEKIKKCNREIEACMWMKVEDFLKHPQVHEGNRFFVKKCIQYQQEGSSIGCIQSKHAVINRPQCVYSIMTNDVIPVYELQNDR